MKNLKATVKVLDEGKKVRIELEIEEGQLSPTEVILSLPEVAGIIARQNKINVQSVLSDLISGTYREKMNES